MIKGESFESSATINGGSALGSNKEGSCCSVSSGNLKGFSWTSKGEFDDE